MIFFLNFLNVTYITCKRGTNYCQDNSRTLPSIIFWTTELLPGYIFVTVIHYCHYEISNIIFQQYFHIISPSILCCGILSASYCCHKVNFSHTMLQNYHPIKAGMWCTNCDRYQILPWFKYSDFGWTVLDNAGILKFMILWLSEYLLHTWG